MKEVPKKELPEISGGVITEEPLPRPTTQPYPQEPTIPGPTDQDDPFKYLE